MRMKKKASIFSLVCAVCFVMTLSFSWSCTKDKALLTNITFDCDTVPASYTNNIAPILSTKCATGTGPGTGCHDSWIFVYSNVKGRVDNGTFELAVVSQERMPPPDNTFGIAPLTDEEMSAIQCWLANGAPED